MSIRTASVVASFLAVAALGTAAQAQSFSSGSYTVTSSDLEVQQTQNLTCNINTFGVSSSGGSTATVTVGSTLRAFPGSVLCLAVRLNGSNWVITSTGGGNVTVSNISATPLAGGNCSGSVTGTYSGNTLTLPWQPIGSSTCFIGGEVTVNGLTLS